VGGGGVGVRGVGFVVVVVVVVVVSERARWRQAPCSERGGWQRVGEHDDGVHRHCYYLPRRANPHRPTPAAWVFAPKQSRRSCFCSSAKSLRNVKLRICRETRRVIGWTRAVWVRARISRFSHYCELHVVIAMAALLLIIRARKSPSAGGVLFSDDGLDGVRTYWRAVIASQDFGGSYTSPL